MSADTPPAPRKVYQLKVVLRQCSPLIWRRLLVTSDTTIAQLHTILQIAMGWEDVHLHRFRIHGKDYGIYREGGLFFADDPNEVRLADFKLRPGERFVYEYDMGDFWQHDIRLEQVLPYNPATTYPVCTAGAEDCPPENCGGPAGYRYQRAARYSWPQIEQAREDVVLVAERILAFYDGGPRPTATDVEFTTAVERMHAWRAAAAPALNRRAVNAALSQWLKESPCTSASN